MTQALPPAGWYPDPQDATHQRYWDGTAWTGHTAPATPTAPAQPPQPTPPVTVPTPPVAVPTPPTATPAWSPMTPGGGLPAAAKTAWYKRKAFLIPVGILVGLIVIGALVGPRSDHSSAIEKSIRDDGQHQLQAYLDQNQPGSQGKITAVDCVETGDTQTYNCQIHLTLTRPDGTQEKLFLAATGSCSNHECLWRPSGTIQPDSG